MLLNAFSLLVLSVLLIGCIEVVRQEQIEVTPGVVPAEIRGATWPDTPVSYCTVNDDEGGFVDYGTFVELTRRAVAAWGVDSAYEGDCGHGIEPGNGTNEVGWGVLSRDPSSLNEAGNTNIRYRSGPGGGPPDIIEADITIEREAAPGRDSVECLYTTLLHEAGHLFGVPHLDQTTVMSPVISDCHQELTQADLDAIRELY